MSLGRRIRELRQSRGLTQSQLGGSDVSKSFISLVERDRARPSVRALTILARRLGSSVDALLGQEGHLPETAAENLLALSREGIRRRELITASRLLEAAEFLVATYELAEAGREANLLQALLRVEEGALDDAWSRAVAVKAACEGGRDYWRMGRSLLLMGRIKLRTRDIPQARELLTEAVDILKRARAGRDPARVEALVLLGGALVYSGRFQQALRRYDEAAKSDLAKRDAVLRGRAWWGVGLAQRKLGKLTEARDSLARARDAMESAEELADLMRVIVNIGQLDYEQGRHKEALRQMHHALRVAERTHSPLDRGAILTEIGRVHISAGNFEEADHFGALALAQAREANDPIEIAEAQVVLARVRMHERNVPAAARMVKEALAIFKEHGMQAKVAQTARDLGLLLKDQG
ncbi:MAG: tetratricopeptide repeat protein, partial [bacterium]